MARAVVAVTACLLLLGARPDARAQTQAAPAQGGETCTPPCAPGQRCVEGTCMVPAPPAPASPPPGYVYPPPYAPPYYPRYGAWLHNGFYLRVALGATRLSGTIDNNSPGSIFGGEVTATGPTLEFALGGTPIPGLVGAGAIQVSQFPAPTIEGGGTAGALSMILLGPMVDFYPSPKAGFHVQAAAGLGLVAWLSGQEPNILAPEVTYTGSGLALSAGGGYEFWVGRQLSLGGLLRITWQELTLRPADVDDRFLFANARFDAVLLSLLANLTFH